ncbi:tRNA pseudouridine(13) synthase TruD [Sulfurivermis fontis]|uniref:tRNA pseudouridine(13) synthase TruD n=1 Tax=Sulfurivermis fontis TaxID=1972068 RepID=UPI000FD824D1|nr:tRNA pseudouridine(13) synthase TruD [Sulfurivermis fontis]
MTFPRPEHGPGLPHWACAHGTPTVRGVLRSTVDDFVVDEDLGQAPDGRGDHILLHVRKRDTNTEWLARELAAFAGIGVADVGFAGLKDRHAVTTQWFSLHLPGTEPDWGRFDCAGVEILDVQRHRRKLRRGELRGNRFRLVVRQLDGDVAGLAARLQRVQAQGVPNYFGEQRFGIGGGNLAAAAAMFAGERREPDRHRRGLYLSAARSLLFNTVLSARVAAGNWQTPLAGEVVQVGETQSLVTCDAPTPAIVARIARGELQLTGPLWGRGQSLSAGAVRELEQAALAEYALWCRGLEAAGLQQERRGLCLRPQALEWALDEMHGRLTLTFHLPAGAYATTVLREVVANTEA